MFEFIAKSFLVIFFLALAALLLAGALAGATYVQVKYYIPWKHARNTAAAEATNEAVWSDGIATTYIVAAEIVADGIVRAATLDIVCARKIDTSNGGFKSGAMIWDYQHNFSPRYITIRVSESFEVVFDARLDCAGLDKLRKFRGVPFTPVSYDGVELRHIAKPQLLCWLPLPAEPFRFKSLEIRPLVVTSVKDRPVREILSKEEYGLADRSLQETAADRDSRAQTKRLNPDQRYYWLYDQMCWGNPGPKTCSEQAMTYCAP